MHPPALALFGGSVIWLVLSQIIAARAASGISMRYFTLSTEPLLSSTFFLFLLVLGFYMLDGIGVRRPEIRVLLGLPRRDTALEEWGTGAAIGWGAVLLATLVMALAGTLHVQIWTAPRAFTLLLVNLAALAVGALAEEIAFRGYPYRRLIKAAGPTVATVIMAVLFGLAHLLNPAATWISVLITMLAGVLLCAGWLRTHGLWLSWGLHFAWNASMGILFGLPVSGLHTFSSIIETRAIGPRWITGGSYGPEASFLTLIALLLAIGALVWLTRDYAWNYTHPPIVPGGYPMDVAPPPAHAAMEAEGAKGPALVQILPSTPRTRSVEDTHS